MGENIVDHRKDLLNQIRADLTGSLLLGKKRTPQAGTPYRMTTRSDNDDLVERPTPVIFGSGENVREFLLYPKPHLEADEWRVAALNVINTMRPAIMGELSLASAGDAERSAEAILNLANVLILGTIPAVAELVFAWEPSLPRDEILIEYEATDTQLAAAFVACLQLAFPFFSTLKQVTRLIQGSQPTPETVTPEAATA